MKINKKIRFILPALCWLMSAFTYAQAQHISLGTNISNAPLVSATVTANVTDGTENFFQIAADNMPTTVYYWPDSLFGPIPMLIDVVAGDTVPAVMVSEACRQGWRWELSATAEEEEEASHYYYFSAHENGATAEIQPFACQPTQSLTIEEACDSLLWNGEWRRESRDYVVHALNAAGCDSTATLRLTIHSSYQITLPDTAVCESYVWQGGVHGDTTIYDSGLYTRRLTTVHGCDSIVTQFVTVNYEGIGYDYVTAYDSYTWIDGTTYKKSINGGPTWELQTVAGCDSIVNLMLTMRHLETDTVRQAICANEAPYVWRGQPYSESGTYSTDTILGSELNQVYHDTVHTLVLTVYPTYAVDTTVTLCAASYTWRGTTYTQSGNYPYNGKTQALCDSIVTLRLTLYQPTQGDTTAAACAAFDWRGQHLTESGDYTHTLVGANVHGCDSILTLHLTIYQPTEGDTTATACVAFDWYGEHLTQSGNYTHLLQGANVHGCDSTVTLRLTIHQPTQGEEWQEAAGKFTWHGTTYTESGDYTYETKNVAGCDSTVTLHLTVLPMPDRDTIVEYYCPKSGITEHIDDSGDPIISYMAYQYERPTADLYMDGVVSGGTNSGANVDLERVWSNLDAYYVAPLTPVDQINWRYMPRNGQYQTITAGQGARWFDTGTLSMDVVFRCGYRYYGSFTVGNMTEGVEDVEETEQPAKRIENGQVVIIRGGKKYTVFGLPISD